MGILETENQISVYQAESKTIALKILDSKNKPFDLTGCQVIFTVRETEKDTLHLFNKTSSSVSQIALITPREGIAEIYISAIDTINLTVGIYLYDIWLVLTDGKQRILVEPSIFRVKAAITKFI